MLSLDSVVNELDEQVNSSHSQGDDCQEVEVDVDADDQELDHVREEQHPVVWNGLDSIKPWKLVDPEATLVGDHGDVDVVGHVSHDDVRHAQTAAKKRAFDDSN